MEDSAIKAILDYYEENGVDEVHSENALYQLGRLQAKAAKYDALAEAAREVNEQLLVCYGLDGWEPNCTNDEHWPYDDRRAINCRTNSPPCWTINDSPCRHHHWHTDRFCMSW